MLKSLKFQVRGIVLNRESFKISFTITQTPDWICPTCQKGTLRLQKDTFIQEESKESREARKHEDFEPEWLKFLYICVFVCSEEKCAERVLSIGVGSVEYDYIESIDGYPEPVFHDVFRPTFFQPHLQFINIPKRCPTSVKHALNTSFKLFFADPSAALNSARIALEKLLTELGVQRFTMAIIKKTGKRERVSVNLHNRIEKLPKKFEPLKEPLLASKWLGNAGSHAGTEVNVDDVLDAYFLIEHVLEELYAPRRKMIHDLAKKINKAKGPIRKRKAIKL